MKKPTTDVVCLAVTVLCFGALTAANLFQPNRPTVSETEKRTLAAFPEFSVSALADGSYFSDIRAFFSDTFLFRDPLVDAARKMDTLKGVSLRTAGGETFVLLDAGGASVDTDASDEELDAFFASLTEEAETAALPETEAPETETSVTEAPVTEPPETEPVLMETEVTESPVTEPVITEPDMTEPANDEPEVTEPAVTETELMEPEVTEPAVTEPEPPAETEPPEADVTAVVLSRDTLTLTVGSGGAITAGVVSKSGKGAPVQWFNSDKEIVSMTVNPDASVNLLANKTGTCVLTCKYNEEIYAQCRVTVKDVVVTTGNGSVEDVDFLTDGFFICGDAVYTQGYYVPSLYRYYQQTALYYKKLFGENTRVHIVTAPVSSMLVDDPSVAEVIGDQKEMFRRMAEATDPSLGFVDTYAALREHRDEYLFFRTDHHWTARGAYYAYAAYAESVGFTPTPISSFASEIRDQYYHGSMYLYTKDERVNSFYDEIEVFTPTKKVTMTVNTSWGATLTYDNVTPKEIKTYMTFIAGDNPYTVINVPDNPQDLSVLVLKDSFGNAFVPFLCEHYGNIYVVDPRYADFNIHDLLGDAGLTDIIFLNNIQEANTAGWARMYLALAGAKAK